MAPSLVAIRSAVALVYVAMDLRLDFSSTPGALAVSSSSPVGLWLPRWWFVYGYLPGTTVGISAGLVLHGFLAHLSDFG